MTFPNVERVVYERNPLVEVVCQLRFPTVLKIEAEAPVAFQEAIRSEYPSLERTQHVALRIQSAGAEIGTIEGAGPPLQYEFISSDEKWKVTLTQNFLALTTSEYVRWEMFRDRLMSAFQTLSEIYQIQFASRIGLRYRNVIHREELGLEDEEWSSLLRMEISGVLSSELKDSVKSAHHQITFEIPDGQVTLRHGLALNKETERLGYLVDADYYRDERTEAGDVYKFLSAFNQQSGRLFRWCITERLHNALRPTAA